MQAAEITISSGNKSKDGDMLRASKDKMTTYIGTKFGDNAAQEWTREKQITLNEPVYPQSILNRHDKRDQITLKVTS